MIIYSRQCGYKSLWSAIKSFDIKSYLTECHPNWQINVKIYYIRYKFNNNRLENVNIFGNRRCIFLLTIQYRFYHKEKVGESFQDVLRPYLHYLLVEYCISRNLISLLKEFTKIFCFKKTSNCDFFIWTNWSIYDVNIQTNQ